MAALILCAIGCTDTSAPMAPPESVLGCYKIVFESEMLPLLGSRLSSALPTAIALVDSVGTGFFNNGEKLVLGVPLETPRFAGIWDRLDPNRLGLWLGGGEAGVIFELTWHGRWSGLAWTFTDVANVPPIVERVRLLARGCN